MHIRIAGTVNDSIVDGPGLRFTVFTQGCPHRCDGCHNPQTHDPAGGKDADTLDIIASFRGNPLLDGITLSGGEPLEQPEACRVLAQAAKESNLSVWVYTGYTWEQLMDGNRQDIRELLDLVDVLVDGRFEKGLRSLELQFCGSRNQRLIDVQASNKNGSVVLWQAPVW